MVSMLSVHDAAKAQAQNRAPVTAEQVQKAIDGAILFFRNTQRKDESDRNGAWDSFSSYRSANTALVVLACVNAGVPPQDPMIDRAMKYVESVVPDHVYEASLQIMAFCALSPRKYEAQILRNVRWLESAQHRGGWGYVASDSSDPSNTQFAILALWEAQRAGFKISERVLESANRYWVERVLSDGSWKYGSDMSGTGSMTCAGIASLLMTRDALEYADATIVDNRLQCCMTDNSNDLVERGMKWLGRNFSVSRNPPNQGYVFYYLYALERVGRLTGARFIQDHDWYREGCTFLLSQQDPIRFYFSESRPLDTNIDTSTALALLFLAKGKRQVVIGRLQYGETNDWSMHRSAIQNLTGQIEKAWKRDLAWQTIQLSTAKLADLLEFPVLFISGREEIKLTAVQKRLLQEYVQQGGLIFAEACNGDGSDGTAFDRSFRTLIEEIFEKPLSKLSPTHPVWFAEAIIDPKALPSDFWLYGLEDCCRTSVIYSPISLSCRWELHRPYGRPRPMPPHIEADIVNATKVGLNVAAYATGRELKEKLSAVDMVMPTPDVAANARSTLILPKLANPGDVDETPHALTNLMEIFKRERPGLVSTKKLTVAVKAEDLEKFSPIYIHGRKRFSFSAQERQTLRTYFENGGVLIGDAICANEEFSASMRAELKAILPEAMESLVPEDHIMLTSECGGFDISRVKLITPSNRTDRVMDVRQSWVAPVLEMWRWNGRVVAIFSPYDLSCALESRHSMQCKGYERPDAARIAINMILYARFADSTTE